MSDIRNAFGQFIRRPGFSLLAVLTLGLGIGATATVFSVVDGVLIQPLPYPDADRLVGVWHRATFQNVTTDDMNLSPPMYFKYTEHSETLENVGIWSAVTANVTGLDTPEQVQTFVMTHEVLPVLGVQPALLKDMLDRSFAATSFTLVMLGVAGAMALLIGVVGIYGVVAYMAARRHREIGVRLALGAQGRDVKLLFVRHGLLLAAIGVAIGLGASFGLMRLMASLLFGVSAMDPATYAVGAIVLLAAAGLASYLPARRALRTDLVAALKAD